MPAHLEYLLRLFGQSFHRVQKERTAGVEQVAEVGGKIIRRSAFGLHERELRAHNGHPAFSLAAIEPNLGSASWTCPI